MILSYEANLRPSVATSPVTGLSGYSMASFTLTDVVVRFSREDLWTKTMCHRWNRHRMERAMILPCEAKLGPSVATAPVTGLSADSMASFTLKDVIVRFSREDL